MVSLQRWGTVYYARANVLRVMTIQCIVLWDVTSRGVVAVHRLSGGRYCLSL